MYKDKRSKIGKIDANQDVYESIAQGAGTVSELRDILKDEKGVNESTLGRKLEDLMNTSVRKEKYPYIIVEGEQVSVDKKGLLLYFREYAISLGLNLVEQEREFSRDMKKKERENESLEREINEMQEIIDNQSDRIHDLEEEIGKLDTKILKAEMERKVKVLPADSIKVGPKKGLTEDIFLDDPHKLLDVEKLVTIYGGELDSFYEEIPSDKKKAIPEDKKKKYDPAWREKYVTKYEPGRELTQDNYRSRTMKRIGTKRFFEKRLQDIETAKEIEEKTGKLFPDSTQLMYNPEDTSTARKRERNRILRNRFETLNRISESDEFTNQEKLMLFAINGNFKHGFMQHYLEHAGKYCINANFLIYLLQGTNPNVCETYDNMIAFLDQFLCPSEFRMILDLARELIEGKWYIEADYNGKKTKFQLVPIDEFNELRRRVGLPVSEIRYKGDDKPADKTEKK